MKEFLVKGNQISITGELSQTEYQAKDGSTKTSLELNTINIDLIGSKKEGGQQAPQPKQAPANDLPYADDFDDSIPF
jgi:single-strand DNA-binding protein